ncbi:MAG: hypothetical protein ACRDEB_01405 [Chitinophagaceae bacterium]
MKFFFFYLFSIITDLSAYAQPGKYAGSKKSLIGKTYTESRNIPGLSGWKFQQGSMITDVNDPELMTADVFKKGNTFIVLFSIKEDTAKSNFMIADVIEVKNVLSSQHIMTGTCTEGSNEAMDVVALTKNETNKEYSKAIKAWRLNRDKRKAELISPKLVKCMNEGD